MRKFLLALSALGLCAAPALAEDAARGYVGDTSTYAATGNVHEVRLNRYVFNAVGQDARIGEVCSGGTASDFDVHRSGSDLAIGILTLGWYTPTHVRVTCSPTR